MATQRSDATTVQVGDAGAQALANADLPGFATNTFE